MEVNLLVGGPLSELPDDFQKSLRSVKEKQIWVGADRGALRLVQWGIKPTLAIGDFDSVTPSELEQVVKSSQEVIIRPLKDEVTDTELAIRFIMERFPNLTRLNIYGATGARLDQMLANLLFVLKPEFQSILQKVKLFDRFNAITFYGPGSHTLNKLPEMKYLAFIPLIAVENLTLIDQKYTLNQANFPFPVALSSNEFVEEQSHFTFTKGIICVIQSKD